MSTQPLSPSRPPGRWARRAGGVALLTVALVVVLAGAAAPLVAQPPTALETEVARLARTPGGTVGVGIRHLESGRAVYLNGDHAFLMGSTFKVPVAVQLLTRVDRGLERLDRKVPLLPSDLFPSGSLLSQRFGGPGDPGADLALRRYLELMLILSDNAATDVVLREIGGTAAVTARLRELGIDGIRVDRTVMEIYWEYTGLGAPPPPAVRSVAEFARRAGALSRERLAEAQAAFHASPKDRATPRAMVALLEAIWRRRALSPASTDVLLAVMRLEETGGERIQRRLPPGTTIASKTGTYGTVVANDVGIVTLPDGAGHLAVAVFTEDPTTDVAAKERIIADVARAAYDFFALAPGAGPSRSGPGAP